MRTTAVRKGWIFPLGVVLVALAGGAAPGAAEDLPAPAPNPWLCPGAFYTEEQGREKLAELGRTYTDRAGWGRRGHAIREGILQGAGLDPLPDRTPLQAIRRGARTHDGH